MKAFMDEIFSPPTKIAILGPVFSSQGKIVAGIPAFYNLLEVISVKYYEYAVKLLALFKNAKVVMRQLLVFISSR